MRNQQLIQRVLMCAFFSIIGLGMARGEVILWTAYHDMGGTTDTSNPNFAGTTSNVVTSHTTSSPTWDADVDLLQFSDGVDTGVNLGIRDVVVNTTSEGKFPKAGSDAEAIFGPTDNYYVNYLGGSYRGLPVTLIFSGLEPSVRYDVAIYGDRNQVHAGLMTFTISGMDSASNSSSAATILSDTQSAFNTYGNGHYNGYLARWSDIFAGSDGTFQIAVTTDNSSNEIWLTALRVQAIIPEPASALLLLFGGLMLCVHRRTRSI